NNIENIISKLSVKKFPLSCKYTNDKFLIYFNGQSTEFDIKDGNVIIDITGKTINSKQVVITSDIHAGYSRWLQLFVYQLEPQLQNKEYSDLKELYNDLIKIYPKYKTDNIETENQIEQAMENIVIDILKQKEGISLYILGDLLDRGDKPVETFNFIKRIFETGKAEFVTGNHDLYAFMNLLGLHLPFYENYKGISDDYDVKILSKNINIQQLLKDKRNQKDKNVNSKIHWATILSDYMEYANDRQQSIWNNYESNLQNLFIDTFYKEFTEDKTVDMLHNPTGIFEQDETLLNFHKKFFGRNVGTTVYTGIRAVDRMSINWWLERKQELEILSSRYPQYQQYWQELDKLISNIIYEQQEKINAEYNNGNWQWAVIDSIMFGNYKTTCWNALDWAYHAKWGSKDRGFIGYRDEQLKRENKEGIDNVSYLEDSLFREMAKFYKDNFYMYKIDDNGICYMHSVLPVDEDSDVTIGYVDNEGNFHTGIKGFIYKGVHYEGINLLKGFDIMCEDIRNYDISSNDLSQIYEALTIITSIYADNTTQIKPANVKEMKEAGFTKIFSKIGLGTVVAGHNPIEK
ncbi:MAG: metallophosphoesterase, partial [Elusimicrobia bacterium]|nr:metallophosphoesterase [Elusimicrobiota bacterium]